jgi:hypothetical protein
MQIAHCANEHVSACSTPEARARTAVGTHTTTHIHIICSVETHTYIVHSIGAAERRIVACLRPHESHRWWKPPISAVASCRQPRRPLAVARRQDVKRTIPAQKTLSFVSSPYFLIIVPSLSWQMMVCFVAAESEKKQERVSHHIFSAAGDSGISTCAVVAQKSDHQRAWSARSSASAALPPPPRAARVAVRLAAG